MTLNSVSDLAMHIRGLNTNDNIKTRLNNLSQELATGQVTDLNRTLRGESGRLLQIDRRLSLLGSYQNALTESKQMMDAMQTALENVDNTRNLLLNTVMPRKEESSEVQRLEVSRAAEDAFRQVVSLANSRNADKALFAGTATTGTALADADTILADLSAAVAGMTSGIGIEAAVDAWFNTAGGGFETSGYVGSNNALSRPAGENLTLNINATGLDSAFRETLKATAMAIVASDPGVSLTDGEAEYLVSKSADALLTAAAPIAQLQSRIGAVEATAQERSTQIIAEETALSIARNDLASVDPFETVTALREAESQLQTHYAVTARLSSLSITGYLR